MPSAAPTTSGTSRSRGSSSATWHAPRQHALDFDDLLLKPVELFDDHREQAARVLRAQFRYVMIDEYQDTNRPQYMLIRQLAEAHRNLASSAIPISRSTGGAAPTSGTSSTSSATSRRRQMSGWSRTIARRRSSSTPQARSSARTRIARTSGSGPTGRAVRASFPIAATTSSRKPTSSSEALKQARSENIDGTLAVLYRINAQSRAIEDSLMRESIPYKIIGGVRFYERKEIKDSLAYLKLIINPHDDVSLRRVMNVPARGVGKGLMDSLQAIDPGAVRAEALPLLSAGLQETASARRSGPSWYTPSRMASCPRGRYRRCGCFAT